MKTDVFPPEGSLEDIQRQVKDVVASVLHLNTMEIMDEARILEIAEQIQEQLKPMARKIGPDHGYLKTMIDMTPQARDEMELGRLSGHVDIGVRFYFKVGPEPTGMQPGD
jgi:hypothetical protein